MPRSARRPSTEPGLKSDVTRLWRRCGIPQTGCGKGNTEHRAVTAAGRSACWRAGTIMGATADIEVKAWREVLPRQEAERSSKAMIHRPLRAGQVAAAPNPLHPGTLRPLHPPAPGSRPWPVAPPIAGGLVSDRVPGRTPGHRRRLIPLWRTAARTGQRLRGLVGANGNVATMAGPAVQGDTCAFTYTLGAWFVALLTDGRMPGQSKVAEGRVLGSGGAAG
jgi:hypothetical protein